MAVVAAGEKRKAEFGSRGHSRRRRKEEAGRRGEGEGGGEKWRNYYCFEREQKKRDFADREGFCFRVPSSTLNSDFFPFPFLASSYTSYSPLLSMVLDRRRKKYTYVMSFFSGFLVDADRAPSRLFTCTEE